MKTVDIVECAMCPSEDADEARSHLSAPDDWISVEQVSVSDVIWRRRAVFCSWECVGRYARLRISEIEK
jgi:hypothetical protein